MSAKGKCLNMCPPEEIEMRERERLLHPLEVLRGTEKYKRPEADPYRMVKCFCRSAAGVNLSCPDILRPPDVLIKTITYLFTHVVNDTRFSTICVYDFVVDRLRSIQQDMVIQDLPSEDCIRILEPIVRFHALFGYRLCEEKISNYDPVLNKKHLMEYLKRLLVCYDDIEQNHINMTMPSLVNNMNSLTLNSNSYESDVYVKHVLPKRPVVEAIYLMSNLGDSHPLERYLKIPDKFKTTLLKSCFVISLSHITRNWVRECQLMKTLPPIVMCVGALYLPAIRRTALEVMSHAYNSKVLKYPIDNIKEILLYDDDSQVIGDCLHYNIKQNEGKFICFLKESFNNNDKMIPPKKIALFSENLFQKNLEKLLLVCS